MTLTLLCVFIPSYFLTPRSEIKDEITQVKTTPPAKVSSSTSISAFGGLFFKMLLTLWKSGWTSLKEGESHFQPTQLPEIHPLGEGGEQHSLYELGPLSKRGRGPLVCCLDALKTRVALTNGTVLGKEL